MKKHFRSGSPRAFLKALQKHLRHSSRANALIEYVVPMSVLLIAVGVMATVFDINDVIGEYFMAASGHTKNDMENGTLKTEPMASSASGTFGNGSGGFTTYAVMTNGSGGPVTATGSSTSTVSGTTSTTTGTTTTATASTVTVPTYSEVQGAYNGPLSRNGSRVNAATATAGERLYIFDDERSGTIRPAPAPLTAPTTTATGTTATTTTTSTTTTTTL